jgi:hypothetical protein
MQIRRWLFAFFMLVSFALPWQAKAQDKATKSLTLTVNSGTVAISTATIPGGMVGLAYSTTIAATGGLSPYNFTVTAGALPAGLTLASTTGILSGTPTTAGSSTFTVQVVDAETPTVTATQAYTLVIVPTLTITTSTLPAANIGVNYSTTIVATGGVSPYTFAVTTGALPSGLTLSSTGVISGTPTSAGSFSFTITVTDSGSNIVRLEIKTNIEIAAVITKGDRS